MEDPKSLSAPLTAFNADTTTADETPAAQKKYEDDNGQKAGSESSENTKNSDHGDATEVNTPKSADLEANALRNSSVSRSNQEQEKSEEAIDPNIVDWDGPNDPSNPLNWPTWKIKTHIFLVSSITFISPLGSSILATGIPQILAEFRSTNAELGSLVVSVYLLGFAAGPLVIAPLSELYGRMPLYHICNILFAILTVGCALGPTLNSEIGLRFLQGCAGSAPLAIGGGTISDLIPQERRGKYMGIYALGPTLGPIFGPVAGGFLTGAKGWRWLMWLLLMIEGSVTLVNFVVMRETYGVVIMARKTRALQKQTGNMSLRSRYDQGLTTRRLWRNTLIRPAKMLVYSPIIFLLSLFMAMVYGYLYLLFTTFPVVFGEYYHFSIGITGLVYLGLGIGNIIGLVIFGVFSDKILLAKAASGELKPEYRLLPMVWTSFTVPIGLFIYGWSARYAVHWIVPIIGTVFFGIGLLVTLVCTLTYIVDAFTEYAASATAANAVMRSVVGATLPLAGPSMYQALGIGWGNSLLAFIALAGCPIPWVFYVYGERIRKSSKATY
uniref:MFS-type transporter atr4 n=1 Tax=Stereocaulon alpinum TaxID=350623 RepID=ATR4_STEAL|nr:RecName: Full=MFS-type transporter atr4; AltName: Full=Atranorin biosynthesis cluster protein 4 [Stereocaulon alpinum]QXF68950.1 atr4 [Stereocaulon alpinum]